MDAKTDFFLLRVMLCTLLLMFAGTQNPASGQELPPNDTIIREMEFINRPLGEILLALARFGQIPLLPDPGLEERRSYYFRDIRLDQVISEIISTNQLYLHQKGSLWIASRMRVEVSDDRKTFSIHAVDVPMESLLNRLSELSAVAIRSSSLPAELQTIHCEHQSLADALTALMLPYPEYRLERRGEAYVIRDGLRNSRDPGDLSRLNVEIMQNAPRSYRIEGNGGSGATALEQLFRLHEVEYQFFTNASHPVSSMSIRDSGFQEALQAICIQSGLRCIEHEGVYSVFPEKFRGGHPVIEQEALSISSFIPRMHSAEYLKSCVPDSLAERCSIRLSANAAGIIIRGNREESRRITRFLSRLDASYGIVPRRISLDFITLDELTHLLPPALGAGLLRSGTGGDSVYALLDAKGQQQLSEYLKKIDLPPSYHSIYLRHQNAEQIIEHIPDEFASGSISAGNSLSSIEFRGSSRFAQELEKWVRRHDQPKPGLEYHILALQVQKGRRNAYGASLGAKTLTENSRPTLSASLGRVIGLNFDVLSTFGYSFALNLETDLSRSSARIMADSMISGVPHQEARLENTSTYRYRDSTGETAVTREITSGLTISITGEISGSGSMNAVNPVPAAVDMSIDVELSRRGVDGGSGNPPPTNQRRIQTRATCSSGDVIRVAGSIITEEGRSLTGVLPLGSLEARRELNEFVLYIRPVVRNRSSGGEFELPEIQDLHARFFQEPRR